MPSNLENINNGTQLYTASEIDALISGERTAIGTASGTNTYSLTLSPALSAYAFGQVFDVQFTNACTGACTLNINGIGAKTILRDGSIALKEGDILAGQVYSLFYDGTNFQIIGLVGTDWYPDSITLGDTRNNGASTALNTGAGYYVDFDSSSDDEIVFTVDLEKRGREYDGSTIILEIDWMKFGATGGTVKWELDYAFVSLGENAFTKIDGTEVVTVDVTSLTNQTLTTNTIPPLGISGDVGAKLLQCTLRRNSTGAGADTYSGAAELYGINVKKL